MWPLWLISLGSAAIGYVTNDAADTAGRITATKEKNSGSTPIIIGLVAMVATLIFLLIRKK